MHPHRTLWILGSTWEGAHRKQAPFTPSTTSETKEGSEWSEGETSDAT